MTVLLVIHPLPSERARLRDLAARVGFTVCEADDGAVGLALTREAAPAIVLVGVHGGIPESLAALRLFDAVAPRLSRRTHVKSHEIWVAGIGSPELRGLALDLGADVALGPIGEGRELVAALENHLRPRRASTASIGSLP